MPTSRSRSPIEESAASAAFWSSGSVSGAARNSSSRLLICGSVVVPSARTAASRSSRLPETSRAAARLCCIAMRISGSFSAAMAFSSNAASAAEGCLSASWAAARRAAGLVLNRVSAPSAPSISPRRRLLTMMRLEAVGIDTGDVLVGDRVAHPRRPRSPVVTEMTTRPSAPLRSRPSVSAWRIGTARGSPERSERDDRLFLVGETLAGETPDERREIIRLCDVDAASRKQYEQRQAGEESITAWSCDRILHRTAAPPKEPKVASRTAVARSIAEFWLGAIAADPGISPLGDFSLVFGKIGAPGVRLDRLLGLPHDVELPIGPDLADHDRLG